MNVGVCVELRPAAPESSAPWGASDDFSRSIRSTESMRKHNATLICASVFNVNTRVNVVVSSTPLPPRSCEVADTYITPRVHNAYAYWLQYTVRWHLFVMRILTYLFKTVHARISPLPACIINYNFFFFNITCYLDVSIATISNYKPDFKL